MVKIRLQRHGKKHYPVYHIVVSNSKSPRNGKIIKKIGIYNPNIFDKTKQIIIKKDNVKELKKWLKVGAQPTKTIKTILKKLNN
ncbi:MAG: 30S ribosomal protein S16 [Candidatus Shikimatogenerans bostrichidophilus]|nr:MAG: 30S ribosomal protein S16 [Candidatus Shikimatogenerans bostrichidophilus]